MRPLIVANIEQLGQTPMFVANLYGEDGYLLDQVMIKADESSYSLTRARQMAERAGFPSVEFWTSSNDLFRVALYTPGFAARVMHPEDTKDTRQAIEQYRDILMELYADDIKSEKERQLPPAGRFRKWSVLLLQRILKTLGADKYDFGV